VSDAARAGFSFEEAIKYAESRKAVLPQDYYSSVPAAVRNRAFTVSALASLDEVQSVLESLNGAVAKGLTFKEWQTLADDTIAAIPTGVQGTVFRNAVQGAYAAGRYEQQLQSTTRTCWLYDAVNDARTRPTHAAMDGFIAPRESHIWQTWYPPNGHNCRCSVTSLTEAQARARGYKVDNSAPNVQPDAGWAQSFALSDGATEEQYAGLLAARRLEVLGESKLSVSLPVAAYEALPERAWVAKLDFYARDTAAVRGLGASQRAGALLTVRESEAVALYALNEEVAPLASAVSAGLEPELAAALQTGLAQLPKYEGALWRSYGPPAGVGIEDALTRFKVGQVLRNDFFLSFAGAAYNPEDNSGAITLYLTASGRQVADLGDYADSVTGVAVAGSFFKVVEVQTTAARAFVHLEELSDTELAALQSSRKPLNNVRGFYGS
jgi:SPP1 gp7 family putative phage head morphogenesis protein